MNTELKIDYQQVAYELTQELAQLTMHNAVLKTAVNSLTAELNKKQEDKED